MGVYSSINPTERAVVDQAWDVTSRVLNPDSIDYPNAEANFRNGYGYAEHNGSHHFNGIKGNGVDLLDRVLTIHEMWTQETNLPDSAALVLGMLAALNAQMNQGGNA